MAIRSSPVDHPGAGDRQLPRRVSTFSSEPRQTGKADRNAFVNLHRGQGVQGRSMLRR
ncbi:hypothetical protein JWG42_11820 [Desulfoprunum benzoelyticum]|uniref:hypothetical protein n=1 Tax=Desulfoprunum benzoelyticum TaxID=1506996 RepID=UPI0019649595|nr:hypothetical protein [Desulfoprunum benzoelyticum]MBM9530838.1 hypothetical protein [Desulfoprunum benzoelyticum]